MRRFMVVTMSLALVVAACGASEAEPGAVLVPDPKPNQAPTTEPALEPSTAASLTTQAPVGESQQTDPGVSDPAGATMATDAQAVVPEEVPPPVVIVSADESLAIEVSAADASRVNPSIRLLDPTEWPVELVSDANLPGVKIYELEPDGAPPAKPLQGS